MYATIHQQVELRADLRNILILLSSGKLSKKGFSEIIEFRTFLSFRAWGSHKHMFVINFPLVVKLVG